MAIAKIVFARKTVAGFQIEAGQQVLYGLTKSNYYVSYGLDRPLKFAFEWGLLFVLIHVTTLITFREPLRRWWWAIVLSLIASFVGISGICGAAEPMIP